MKRLLLALGALLSFSTSSLAGMSISGGNQGAGGGMGSAATAAHQWSGTLCIVMDDGTIGTATQVAPLLRQINDEFGLTGTPCEMHMTTGVNPRGVNGLQGYQGLTGSATSMTVQQVRDLYDSGLWEIASHSQHHLTCSNIEFVSGGSARVRAPWPVTGITDSTQTTEIRDSFFAIRDTIGISQVYSFVSPHHRLDDHGIQVAAKYYKNVRRGNLWRAFASFQTDSLEFPVRVADLPSDGVHDNVDRGIWITYNQLNVDPMTGPWFNYDYTWQGLVMPFTPMSRVDMPHMEPPSNGSTQDALNVSETKDLMVAIAETKGFGILVWHDIYNSPPGTGANQDLGGILGVEEVLRFAAQLCVNTLVQADAPKLQVLTLNEGTNKKVSSLSYIDGAINVVDNFRLLADRNSNIDGDIQLERPYGFPDIMVQAWADSGWAYEEIDSTSAGIGGVYFGYFDDSAIFCTPPPRVAVNEAANFKSLVQIYPVIPGSMATLSCYAWTDTLTMASGATPNDSLSACWINIDVIPLRHNGDPSDSSAAWIRTPGSPGNLEQNAEIGEQAMSDYVGVGAEEPQSRKAYSKTRLQTRFHSRDMGNTLRNANYTNPWYNDGTPNNQDRDMRWRPFKKRYLVPNDAYWIRVEYRPTGWTNTTSDHLALCGLECQLTAR